MSDKNKQDAVPGREYPLPEASSDDAGLGSVQIHNNVYALIAHEAADRVPGVIELSGTLVDGLADMIGKRSRDRGIRVAVESEDVITVELTVVLEYGLNIPEICGKLQTEVRQAIEDLTGVKVQAVNVVVQGIRRETPEADAE